MNRLALALLAVLSACATPVAPTGGPADSVPPALIRASPSDGATNVTDSTLVLTFSERLDAGSSAAITVTPTGDIAPEVQVVAREVEISLPGLRDSTTYVVTIGTELRDTRSVALRSPITLAFATGDQIDGGTLGGTLRDPATGDGLGSRAVWAYAGDDPAPDPSTVAPDYRTETGADGAFELRYLRPGPYFVIAVADRNRNGRADPGEAFAAPPIVTLEADTTAPPPVTLWETRLDSIPPQAQRVRALSDRRFAIRFSEFVRPSGGMVAIEDSTTGQPVGGSLRLYQPENAGFELFVEAETALPPRPVRVSSTSSAAVIDSAGIAPNAFALSFTPPSRPDTVQSRFIGFVPTSLDSIGTLRRGESPGVRFSGPPDRDRLALRADGVALEAAFVSDDGVVFRPDSSVALPERFALEVAVGDTIRSQRYAVPGDRDTGAIIGRVEGEGPIIVEVQGEAGPPVAVSALEDGSFSIDGLLPGPYSLRAWSDLDGNGKWSGGALSPFRAPEPLVLLAEPITARARWETEIDPITL